MAKIDVPTTVTAPDEINIPLIRADYHAVSNIFRVAFEVFLACFSGFLGAALTMPQRETVYCRVLVIFGLAAVLFAYLSYSYGTPSGKD